MGTNVDGVVFADVGCVDVDGEFVVVVFADDAAAKVVSVAERSVDFDVNMWDSVDGTFALVVLDVCNVVVCWGRDEVSVSDECVEVTVEVWTGDKEDSNFDVSKFDVVVIPVVRLVVADGSEWKETLTGEV